MSRARWVPSALARRVLAGSPFVPAGAILLLALLWVVVTVRLPPASETARIGLGVSFALLAAAIAWIGARFAVRRSRPEPREALRAEAEALAHVGRWEWEVPEDRFRWTEEMVRIHGLEPEREALGLDAYLSLVHAEDRDRVARAFREGLESGEPFVYRAGIVRPDGGSRHVFVKARVEADEAGQVARMYGVCQDRTGDVEAERKLRAREAELEQARKMEAVGRLAAGVAHDFNNLLTAIRGYTDLARARLEPESPLHEALQEVRDATDRAAGLTRRLTALGREEETRREIVDLNDLVRRMEPVIRPHLGSRIRLETRPEVDLWPVSADPGQLEQVVLNLAVNAADAIAGEGRVTIRTRNQPETRGALSGPHVVLEVSDTGPGIPEEIRAHVFEPFFTTKGDEGTGLGLATSYALVRRNGGAIEFRTREEGGTTFLLRLPRHVAALVAERS
ncbi:MAG: ATP-binding protein [Gemmatimonadota bacterium]|nr:ATP-binding protein [Gemmatimonadota bacterium]